MDSLPMIRWQRFFNARIILLLLIIGFVFFYMQLKSGRFSDQSYPSYDHYKLVTQKDCDLVQTGCMSIGDDVGVLLQFQSSPSALKAFGAEITIKQLATQPDEVKLSFVMQGMEMGVQAFALQYKNTSGKWEGEVILPICTSGRSDWQVIVEITQGDRIYSSTHQFMLN